MKLRVLVLVLLMMVMSVGSAIAETWQFSSSPLISFGVRNKFGNYKYTANFVVHAPNDKIYYCAQDGHGDDFVYSFFPNSYKGAYFTPGEYVWECYVNGNKIASKEFHYSKNENGDGILTIIKEYPVLGKSE